MQQLGAQESVERQVRNFAAAFIVMAVRNVKQQALGAPGTDF